MQASNSIPAWMEPDWREQSEDWIRTTLAGQELPVTGEIQEYHLRPWSAVLMAPTAEGTIYFKAGAPYLSNEAALMQAFHSWRPDCMVRVLAADVERRWLLMADEGVRLRTVIKEPEDLSHFEKFLPLFAEVQIEMVERKQELLRLGIVPHPLEKLPEMFAGLLADGEALRLEKEDGLTAEQHDRLHSILPRYAELIARLREFPIPETLHHDDFHDGNVFYRNGRYTFSDWGDTGLTHPFFSVVITLRSASDRLGLPDEATEDPDRLPLALNRLRDAYLEPWTRYASLSSLREIFPTAWRAGMVNRALGWYHEIQHEDAAGREENGYTVPAWLGEFLLAM